MEKNMIPTHVAIIMDGNGRWAKERGLSRNEGHKRGSEVLREIAKYAEKKGVKYLTVYAFSTENWNRPKEEVDGLMNLMRRYMKDHLRRAKRDDIRFKVIGDKLGLPEDIRKQIADLEELTEDKKGLCMNLALNYGGRDEIVRGVKQLVMDCKLGKIEIDSISEERISQYLDTAHMPDPDLMIRTSGELRTSNFLPWQLAYTEFYFAECLWPEFNEKQFDEALEAYSSRKRRFGKSE
ncbi:MAG: isoprenyl transferase [Cellulosilyticaceae bacterium]